jgi:2-polyprenyl-3-methyl-5-hydroxy-6-metoxy-1,4-benzoquinol methylase
MTTNPYRAVFYGRQYDWHGSLNADQLRKSHDKRACYYRWYTRGWLPEDKSAPILDLACGAGQFVYFLRKEGYQNVVGVDVDSQQISMAAKLGLDCRAAEAGALLSASKETWALIGALDVLEHLTRAEMFELLELVAAHLAPGGRLILSVPNASSPQGLVTRYSDITHETAFTTTSMEEALFCHKLRVRAVLDPWPAPVDFPRRLFRCVTLLTRSLEGMRLRLLGLSKPSVWSPVFWMMAEKESLTG